MGHGQDGPSLRGQSRGKNEGPMTGVPSPHGNLLAPFSGSRCPERKSRVLTGFKDPVGVGSHFSISPTPNSYTTHFPSVMPTLHASRPLHMRCPLPGHHTHTFTRLTLKHPPRLSLNTTFPRSLPRALCLG